MGGTYRSVKLLVCGPLATGWFHQKSTVGGRLREKSTVGGRLREKLIVDGRLREKKGRRRRGKEEKKKRGVLISPRHPRRRVVVARGSRVLFLPHKETERLPAQGERSRRLQAKGLRDDTTCIVVDMLPPEKLTPSVPPKKQGMRVFKHMFCRKSSESSSHSDRGESPEPDVVEEIFEEGSASLAQRLEAEYPIRNMFKLFVCAVCQVEMKPGEGISVHADSSQRGNLRPWDGPFLCLSCQEKKEAMEGKRSSRGGEKKKKIPSDDHFILF
ncbi:hypothetical protein BHM03_00050954 [Ensete ventricosum]|nr:hypothetical protein BHM03_00050954 [Ensete ventricosum]